MALRCIAAFALAMVLPAAASAQTPGPSCLYLATNSSSQSSCFATIGEAEDFIRADPSGTHPARPYLEQVGAAASVSGATTADLNYAVKPRPATEGPRGYQAASSNSGASTSYTQVGCNTDGVSAAYISYGPVSNCSNTPSLCVYDNYCTSRSSLSAAIQSTWAAQGKCAPTVSPQGSQSATPLQVLGGPPDDKAYPPGTGTFIWSAGDNYERLRIQWPSGGSSCSGPGDMLLVSEVASPAMCPAGFTIQGSELDSLCRSVETGKIVAYRLPTDPAQKCPDKSSSCYGNPVIAATGAKIQQPRGWNADPLFGLKPVYNSMTGDRAAGSFGDNWASLLESRFVGKDAGSLNYTFSDEVGNLEVFTSSSSGVFRSRSSSQDFMRITTTPICELTVFRADRRQVYPCSGNDGHLSRVEYPNTPNRNFTLQWATADAYNASGVQTQFSGYPTMLLRSDGRRVRLVHGIVYLDTDCQASCTAVRLTGISQGDGSLIVLEYNSQARLSTIYYPDGNYERFEYGAAADICPASMPGACTATTSPKLAASLLTGIYVYSQGPGGSISSNRAGTYQYDNLGRAIVTTHAEDAGRTEFRYAVDGTPSVRIYTDATHYFNRTISSTRVSIYDKPTTVVDTDPSGTVIRSMSTGYDGLGYSNQATDFKGIRTDYTLNDSGLEVQRVEAANDTTGKRRTFQTDWNLSNRTVTERRTYDSAASLPGTLVSRVAQTLNTRGQVSASCAYDPANAAAMAYVCGTAANAPLGVVQTRYTYCEAADVTAATCPIVGQLRSVDGPRVDIADVSTFQYYQATDPQDGGNCDSATVPYCAYYKGDISSSTNALGQLVSRVAEYDGVGRVTHVRDINNVKHDFEYSSRGWLTRHTDRGSDNYAYTDDMERTYEYDSVGNITKVTQGDGTSLAMSYDGAYRVTGLYDGSGSEMHFELDYLGNRILELNKDPGELIKRQLARQYDNLGQLQKLIDANSAETVYSYDANGNDDLSTDRLGRIANNDVDALNRVVQLIENSAGGSNDRRVTQMVYDARDNLVSVTDPKSPLATNYTYDGLGRLTQLSSPDTGLAVYGYDNAGNRISRQDARGTVLTSTYDSLGRITLDAGPTASQNVTWTWDMPQADGPGNNTFCGNAGADTAINGVLGNMTDESGSTWPCYDLRGNLIRKTQIAAGGSTLAVESTFNHANRVVAMTYPSGAVVAYHRDSAGRIDRVDVTPTGGGSQSILAQNVQYLPFGPLKSLTFGNGRSLNKTYNGNYDIDSVADTAATAPLSLDFDTDAGGRISGVSERLSANSVAGRTYLYDGLDRVLSEKNGNKVIESFTYEPTGDRLSKTAANKTTAYTYAASSHRLTAVGTVARTYDAAGNTLTIGTGSTGVSLTYDDRGRLRDYKLAGIVKASYRYNGRGEQVLRIDAATPANSRQYMYGEAGQLLGEYTMSGTPIQEYVWLDNTLVGILSGHDGSAYQFVETDHLGTPRAVVHPSKNTIVWRWNLNDTVFGDHAPLGDPDGNAQTYSLALRFRGQRQDPITGLNYNFFRDYDAGTGRYIESDPIGLLGDISSYGYAKGNPLKYLDPLGLCAMSGKKECPYTGRHAMCCATWDPDAWDITNRGRTYLCRKPINEACKKAGVLICCNKDFQDCADGLTKEQVNEKAELQKKYSKCTSQLGLCMAKGGQQ